MLEEQVGRLGGGTVVGCVSGNGQANVAAGVGSTESRWVRLAGQGVSAP